MKKVIIVLSIFVLIQNINAQCFHQTTEEDDFTIISDEVSLSSLFEVTVGILSKNLRIFPYVGVYDSNEINAVAFGKKDCDICGFIKKSNNYGYIFVSKKLNYIANKQASHKAIFIIAHEMGHILYFNIIDKTLDGEFKIKDKELFADYIAGFSINVMFQNMSHTTKGKEDTEEKKLETRKKMADIYAKAAFDGGDTQFNNPKHHGTKLERVSAFNQGWKKAEVSTHRDSGLIGAIQYIIDEAGLDIKIKK